MHETDRGDGRGVALWLLMILAVPLIIIGLFAANGFLLRP